MMCCKSEVVLLCYKCFDDEAREQGRGLDYVTRLELSPRAVDSPKVDHTYISTVLDHCGLITDYCSRHTLDCALQWWACLDMQIFYLESKALFTLADWFRRSMFHGV